MADSAVRHFLPWVRQGAAAGISTPDSLGPGQRADVVAVGQRCSSTNFTVPAKDMKLYGPADVTAIDPRQIVRVQPRPLTTNFESNFFPLIEFDRPDFPWLFTPARAGAGERLRPWICLIVVRKRAGVRLGRTETSPLPVLEIGGPASLAAELPDLEDSWAWAHAQVVGRRGDTRETLKLAIENAPARTLSRLICPRRLDPDVAYIACVVPAFEVGRKAALGLPVSGASSRNWRRPGASISRRHPFAARVLLVGVHHRPGRRLRIPGARSRAAPLPDDGRDASARYQRARLRLAVGRRPPDEGHPASRRSRPMRPAARVPQALRAALAEILNAPADALQSVGGRSDRRAADLRRDVSASRSRRGRSPRRPIGSTTSISIREIGWPPASGRASSRRIRNT